MERQPWKKHAAIAVVLGVGFLLLVGAALGTPGSGVLPDPGPPAPGTRVQARGTLDTNAGPNLVINSKSGVQLRTSASTDLVTQVIAIAPGGHTGWHSHPGPVLVTVKEGSLQLIYADDTSCQGRVYEAGDSFIDRGDETVHIARASPLSGVVLWATYFVPGTPLTTGFRIDAPDPGTGC
jgi:hypothetical protein